MVGLAGSEWVKGAKSATRVAKVFFITGISWGSGERVVKTFTHSADPAKALRLRTKTAIKVASYLRSCGKSPFVTA